MGGASSSGGNDNDVSGAEAVVTGGTTYSSRKINTKKKPADYNPEKDDTEAKLSLFYNQGATDIKNKASKVPSPALAILSGPLQAGSKMTREFFTNKVLTSERGMKNLGYTKDEFSRLSRTKQEEVYKSYLTGRQSGTTDAYGNVKPGGGNDNQPILSKPKTTYVEGVGASAVTASPTKAEMDQATATTMSADETLLATNKKGRSENILTSAKGLGDTNLTIKRKTLG